MRRLLTVVLAFGAGCSARDRDAGQLRSAVSASADLISTATCAQRGGKLVSCSIAPRTFTFTPFDNAIPLRTTVVAQRSGNCSTQYPLQVSLTADQEPVVQFPYIQGGQTQLRRADHGLVGQLAMADSSSWTPHAAFDPSCAISLQVSANEPDVDSKADAQAVIDKLTKDVASKQASRDQALALDLYQKAYVFLRNVADNFLGQLTNQQMQDLRAAALDAQPSLERLITDCNNLTSDQRASLLQLDLGLATLGHPEDWQNPDGSTKTLKDFLGASDQKVLDTINQLAQQATPDGGTPPDYDALYKQAEADYELAQQKLSLAQKQLASYLN